MRGWLLVVVLAIVACEKKADPPKQVSASPTAGAVGTDGVRAVQIEASKDGFVPREILGKPGEKLKLVFTRRASGGDCMAQLKTPEGKIVELPLDKPHEIEVTVPKTGEVKFACGMEMFFGVIVAEKA